MSVGCYDADMQKYTHVPFNLELMKLSSYYKRRGEIVSLAPAFRPNRYTKFIYRKDFDDGDFKSEIFSNKNIEWGGHAFSGNKYIALPFEIETQKPDVYLYNCKRDKFITGISYEHAFRTMERANHFRISLDGKTIWKDFEKQLSFPKTRTLFVHDFDLNQINGSFELLKDMSEASPFLGGGARIGTKFPIQVSCESDLLKWESLPASDKYFSIQYNGLMADQTLNVFLEQSASAAGIKNLDYVVTSSSSLENDFIEKDLSKIYLQVCFLRSQGKKISLKYDSNFFSDQKWGRVIDLFNCYLSGFTYFSPEERKKKINYDTLFSFCSSFKEEKRYGKECFTKQDARDLFRFVADKNYDLFKMFYEVTNVRLENGRLIPI